MARISPFKAIRPVRDKVHLVATRPYYSYTQNVLKAKLEDNPFTLLRIINPEFESEKHTAPNSLERFELVKEKYAEFIQDGILFQDKDSHLYIYRQTKEDHVFTGVIAGASIAEYEADLIRKHEATLTSREEMFTNYLEIVGYNAEPVLLAHPHHVGVQQLLNQCIAVRPEYEFTTTDRIKHELWVVNTEQTAALQNAFLEIPVTYIADGHHRSASSARLKKERIQKGSDQFPNEDYFLAFFIDEEVLQILEFNRIVKTLNGLTTAEFLQALNQSFDVLPLAEFQKPAHAHQMTMYLDETWYSLNCHENCIDHEHPVRSLDAEILTQYVLTPILGIQDLKTDEHIEFISGAEPISKLKKKIDATKNSVAFVLYPVAMDEVKRVADNHMIMPPKSTWVEPKLRSGLTIYNINE
ncbi:MAG: hypothetical protein RL632_578 [Bacteroidota bacterium]